MAAEDADAMAWGMGADCADRAAAGGGPAGRWRGAACGAEAALGCDGMKPQRRSGGVAQLDSSALSHERLVRHGPVDEHAVTALAPHRPPGRGGGHLEVGAGDEGVDDLNVAVR